MQYSTRRTRNALLVVFIILALSAVVVLSASVNVSSAFKHTHPTHTTVSTSSSTTIATSSSTTMSSSTTATSTSTSTTSSSSSVSSSSSSGLCFVDSQKQEQPIVYTQIVLASDHTKAVMITGGEITQRVANSQNKNYLYLYVNTAQTTPVDYSNVIQTCTISGFDTNNIYWNAQAPLSSDSIPGNGLDYGTVGEDLVVNPNTGALLLDQYVDIGFQFGIGPTGLSVSSSTVYGEPPPCYIDSLGQERHSIYFMLTTSVAYTITGAEFLEKSFNGVTSTALLIFINPSSTTSIDRSGQTKTCGVLSTSSPLSWFEWALRSPPTTNTDPGNYGVFGTVGGDMQPASSTSALVIEQFMDHSYQIAYP
jgi:hypothetical protein